MKHRDRFFFHICSPNDDQSRDVKAWFFVWFCLFVVGFVVFGFGLFCL